jgi:hypothetical protein
MGNYPIRSPLIAVLKRRIFASRRQIAVLKRRVFASRRQITVLKRRIFASRRQITVLKRRIFASPRQITVLKRRIFASRRQITALPTRTFTLRTARGPSARTEGPPWNPRLDARDGRFGDGDRGARTPKLGRGNEPLLSSLAWSEKRRPGPHRQPLGSSSELRRRATRSRYGYRGETGSTFVAGPADGGAGGP